MKTPIIGKTHLRWKNEKVQIKSWK